MGRKMHVVLHIDQTVIWIIKVSLDLFEGLIRILSDSSEENDVLFMLDIF